jgi:hypothetical protein
MGAERGWIGDPQPPMEWHDSHYSRTLTRMIEETQAEPVEKKCRYCLRESRRMPFAG